MNDKKQLECELKCKASAALDQSIQADLCKEDGNIQELLNETTENTEETID